MSKIEKFALCAGVIGLVADILTLGSFMTSWISDTGPTELQAPIPVSVRVIVTFSLIYSWLIVSWFLVRRTYLLFCERNRTIQWRYWKNRRFAHSKVFSQYVIGAVFGVAILVSPFAFVLVRLWFPSTNSDNPSSVLSTLLIEGIVGIAISAVMMFIMPVVYADIEADLFTMLTLLNPLSSRRSRR
jgi:hypothetical protein